MTVVIAASTPSGVQGVSTAAYGVVADVKTLSDGVITAGTNILGNASGSYVAGDVGKLITVNGAGVAVSASPSGSLSGTITTDPAHRRSERRDGSRIMDTQSGRQLSGHSRRRSRPRRHQPDRARDLDARSVLHERRHHNPVRPPLVTTITAVNSATQVTLNANASTTTSSGSPGEVVYATNNLSALQAAANAAVQQNTHLWIAGGSGEGIGYYGTLNINGHLDIRGAGAHALYGSVAAGAQGFASVYYATIAPYLSGSVLVQFAPNTDGINNNQTAQNGDWTGFGVRFAGKFINTGHAVNTTAPVLSTYFDNGHTGAIKSVKVYGHDGNHYGLVRTNGYYGGVYDLVTFGGGHRLENQNNLLNVYGNGKAYNGAAFCMCAGTAYGVELPHDAGGRAQPDAGDRRLHHDDGIGRGLNRPPRRCWRCRKVTDSQIRLERGEQRSRDHQPALPDAAGRPDRRGRSVRTQLKQQLRRRVRYRRRQPRRSDRSSTERIGHRHHRLRGRGSLPASERRGNGDRRNVNH